MAAQLSTSITLTGVTYHWQVGGSQGQPVDFTDPGNATQTVFTPLDDGRFVAVLTVTADQGTYVDRLDVFVHNLPPAIDLGGPYEDLHEGDVIDFTAAISDPGTADILSVLWTVQDSSGHSDEYLTRDLQITVPEDGQYLVTVRVTDGDGGIATGSVMLSATNAPPTADAGGPYTIDEGSDLELDASASSDPGGPYDPLSYSWDVWDGETWIPNVATGASPILSWSQLVAMGIDNGPATAAVRLTVRDDDGGEDVSAPVSVVVQNVLPIVGEITGPTSPVGEGIAAVFSVSASDSVDAITYEWDFDYDGLSFVPDVIVQQGTMAHAFADEGDGNYTVALRVKDDAAEVLRTYQVSVVNAAPLVVVGSDVELLEGSSFSRTGYFVDPGADVWSATVNYGDGTGELPLAVNSDGTFTLNNLYVDDGTYTVTVTVTDDDGGSESAALHVMVANVHPQQIVITDPATGAPAPEAGLEGTEIVLGAVFADPSAADTHDYRWEVLSNNGQTIAPQQGQLAVHDRIVPPFHFLPENEGVYRVALTIADDDGGQTTRLHQIVVGNLPPTISLTSWNDPATIAEPFTLSGVLADVPADRVTASVDFGDGVSVPLAVVGNSFTASYLYDTPGNKTVRVTAQDSAGATSSQTLVVTVGGLIVTDMFYVGPELRTTPVDTVTIQFNARAIGFGKPDFTLTRDGTLIPLGTIQTLVSDAAGTTWQLKRLSTLNTAEGTYTLCLDAERSGITDVEGNALIGDACVSWTIDTTPPVVSVAPLVTNDTTPAISGTVDDGLAMIEVTLDGNDYHVATNCGDGTWVLPDDVLPAIDPGTYTVTVVGTDVFSRWSWATAIP